MAHLLDLRIADDPDAFWRRVERAESCWLWRGAVGTGGYGFCSSRRIDNGRMAAMSAHRMAWEFARCPIPEGLHLDHLCRVRNCVNPDHLEAVTPQENHRRSVAVRVLLPIAHGTMAGVKMHYYRGVPVCAECSAVRAAYQLARRSSACMVGA